MLKIDSIFSSISSEKCFNFLRKLNHFSGFMCRQYTENMTSYANWIHEKQQSDLLRAVIAQMQIQYALVPELTLREGYEQSEAPMSKRGGYRGGSGRKKKLVETPAMAEESSSDDEPLSNRIVPKDDSIAPVDEADGAAYRNKFICSCGWHGLYRVNGKESKPIQKHMKTCDEEPIMVFPFAMHA